VEEVPSWNPSTEDRGLGQARAGPSTELAKTGGVVKTTKGGSMRIQCSEFKSGFMELTFRRIMTHRFQEFETLIWAWVIVILN